MRYGDMITFGFRQAWKHKSLWLMGFFAAGVSAFDVSSVGHSETLLTIRDFFLANLLLLFLFVLLLMALVASLIFLRFVSEGGLIDAAARLKKNEEYRLGSSFYVGASRFWPLLGLGLLYFIVVVAYFMVLVATGVMAFVLNVMIGVLSLLLLLPLALAGLFVVEISYCLAQRMVVLNKGRVFDSIGDSFALMTANLGPSLSFFIIYLAIMIAIMIGVAMALGFLAMPFVAVGIFNLWLALALGIPIGLIILYLINGYLGSATNLMKTDFYFQIVARQSAKTGLPADIGGPSLPPPLPSSFPTSPPSPENA